LDVATCGIVQFKCVSGDWFEVVDKIKAAKVIDGVKAAEVIELRAIELQATELQVIELQIVLGDSIGG
jgi:hypothetical protein